MVEAVGARVVELTRVKIGSIAIGTLPVGPMATLTRAEVAALKKGSGRSVRRT